MDLRDIGILVGAAVAMLGWIVTRYHALQLAKRKEQLDLVNKRLDEFYGPLYVATRAGRAAYESLLVQLAIPEGIFAISRTPSIDDLKELHHWMKHVLLPLNDVIEKAILTSAYLIREEAMPPPLIAYMNHVATTRAVVAYWELGDYAKSSLPVAYPSELDKYIADSYVALKAEQLHLIGLTSRSATIVAK